MKQKIASVLRAVVGFIFLLTGLLKATDASAFADLISKYGIMWLGYVAPFIIAVEFALGLLLIFNVRPRVVALATIIFTLGVSCVFAYGYLALGITNCGCFGPMQLLNQNPTFTFVRNAVLLCCLVPSLIGDQKEAQWTPVNIAFISIVVAAVMFLCGFSFHGANCTQRYNYGKSRLLSDSPLSEIVTLSPDSTYVVFAFSYMCPYCQNSIGNLKQYQELELVDRVIGICVEDTVGRERFYRLYRPTFEVVEIEPRQMLSIASSLPSIFEIRHDTIIRQYSEMVVSPALSLP